MTRGKLDKLISHPTSILKKKDTSSSPLLHLTFSCFVNSKAVAGSKRHIAVHDLKQLAKSSCAHQLESVRFFTCKQLQVSF